MDSLRGGPIFGEKTGNRNRNEPEPVEPNRGFKDLGVNRTEPNRGLTDDGTYLDLKISLRALI